MKRVEFIVYLPQPQKKNTKDLCVTKMRIINKLRINEIYEICFSSIHYTY